MKYRKLGKTDLQVSEISLGCWTLGGLNWVDGQANGWANVNETEAREAVFYAIDHGVNHFDNADVYGNGRAERMLARILGSKTKDVIIATKVGWFKGTAEHAFDPLHIRHQCEQSLKNLQRDHLDLYYFHHGHFGDHDEYLDAAVEAMNRLKEEGKIRYIGQSAYSDEDFIKLIQKVKPDFIQSFANAINDHFLTETSPVRGLLKEKGISFVAFGPVAQGLLLGKYSGGAQPHFEPGDHRAHAKRYSIENLRALDVKLDALKNRFGGTTQDLVRVAIQYLLHTPEVATVIPGFRTAAQVQLNISVADSPLQDDEYEFVRTLFSDHSVVY